MIKHMSLACLFAVALLVIPRALAYKSYGDDGPVDYHFIQANDATCCGGDGGKEFNFWNNCKQGELVRKICIHKCYTTHVNRDYGDIVYDPVCGSNAWAFRGIEVWWTNAKNLSETRYEIVGKKNDQKDPWCIDLRVDRNERITYAELQTAIDPEKNARYPSYLRLETNSGNSQTFNAPNGYDQTNREASVWKNNDPSLPPTNYLGSGFLCGISGRAGDWIDQLRFNFLPEISSAQLQNSTWSTDLPLNPDGTVSLESQSSNELYCGQPGALVKSEVLKFSTSYSLSTTSSLSSTFGMKFGTKITLSAKQTFGIGAQSEFSQSLELSSEYSKSETSSTQTTESEQKVQEHTDTVNYICPAPSGNKTYPYSCKWKSYHNLAFTWQKAQWNGQMVYQLASGGSISFPTSGTTTGAFYDDLYKQEAHCVEVSGASMLPRNTTSADAKKSQSDQIGRGSRKLLVKQSI